MTATEHHRKLERMYNTAPVNDFFRPAMTVAEGRAEVLTEVRRDFFHAAGAVHGVTYFKLLDDAAFFAANSLIEDVFVLTVSFNLYLTRPVNQGTMKATGEVVSRSKRLLVAQSVLVDGEGRELGRGSGSFMPSRIALGPEVGYR